MAPPEEDEDQEVSRLPYEQNNVTLPLTSLGTSYKFVCIEKITNNNVVFKMYHSLRLSIFSMYGVCLMKLLFFNQPKKKGKEKHKKKKKVTLIVSPAQ